MKCSYCNTENEEKSKICKNCGSELNFTNIKPQNTQTTQSLNTENAKIKVSGFSIAGFVLAIISALFSITSQGYTLIGSIVGLTFCIIGIVETKSNKKSGRGMAIAGLVISIVTLILALLFFLFVYVLINSLATGISAGLSR